MEQAVDIAEIENTWRKDFPVYSQNLLKIQTMEGDLIPFSMNEVQTLLHRIIEEMKMVGRPVRLLILKARREGISTYISGRDYWKTSTSCNRYAMMIAHEPDATDFLFSMIKRYHTHNEWKPEIRYSNKKILEFNTQDGKGLDSAIRVATAGKEDVGSAQLIHYLHLSEVAKWPKHTTEALLTSVLQCVPSDLETEVVFESTAKGVGGEFYDRFNEARFIYEIYLENDKPAYKVSINEDADPNSVYSSVFIPWFVFKKYQQEPPSDFVATSEEQKMVDLYGIGAKHLQWRRWAIPNLCGGDPEKFMQEYPSNAVEAFLSSGQNVFNAMQCLRHKKAAPKPIARYECMPSVRQWIQEPRGRLKVWEESKPGQTYVIGADVAEGLPKGDFSSADVVNRLTGAHVAQWHGKCDPDIFAIILLSLALRYNSAWVAPERNNHGIATVTTLMNLNYGNIWVEKVAEPPNPIRKRYGFLTSRTTKPLIIDNLVALMREGCGDQIRCAESFGEMMSFVQDDKGKLGAEGDKLDDRVISMAITQYIRNMLPLPAVMHVDPKKYTSSDLYNMKKDPSPLAWT